MTPTEELMTLIDRYAFFVPGSESSDLAREDVKRAIDLALQDTRDGALEDAAKALEVEADTRKAWPQAGAAKRKGTEAIRAMKGK